MLFILHKGNIEESTFLKSAEGKLGMSDVILLTGNSGLSFDFHSFLARAAALFVLSFLKAYFFPGKLFNVLC